MANRGRPPKNNGTRLAQWLWLTGRSRTAFAQEVGVSLATIARICKGGPKAATSRDIARRIVAATDNLVTFADLFAEPSQDSAA